MGSTLVISERAQQPISFYPYLGTKVFGPERRKICELRQAWKGATVANLAGAWGQFFWAGHTLPIAAK